MEVRQDTPFDLFLLNKTADALAKKILACSEYSEQHFRDCQRRISKAPTAEYGNQILDPSLI
jgi:hypothetical protein